MPHEAGYDSFVTAKALIRLSRNLEGASEGKQIPVNISLHSIDGLEIGRQTESVSDLMPPFGSDFWAVYGNKLRVYGTEEGVCKLGA